MKILDHANFWRNYFARTERQQPWMLWVTAEDKLAMLDDLMQWDNSALSETEADVRTVDASGCEAKSRAGTHIK